MILKSESSGVRVHGIENVYRQIIPGITGACLNAGTLYLHERFEAPGYKKHGREIRVMM